MKTCAEFSRQGVRVELWTPRRRNSNFRDADPFVYHGVEKNFLMRRLFAVDLTELPLGDVGLYVLLLTFNVSVWFRALRLGQWRQAVFFAHDLRDVVLLSLLSSKLILEIHDFYKTSISWFNRLVFRRVAGFVVTNSVKASVLMRDYAVPAERIIREPNAVSIEQFSITETKPEVRRRLGLPEDPNRTIAVYTGHLFSWKGVDTLLTACKLLDSDTVVYFVGGTDEDLARFRALHQSLGIGERAVIVGRRPHAEIPLWLRAADVAVLPNTAREEASKYETSPVKLFEYLAAGVPIVASDLPSIRDVITNDHTHFFASDDPQALAEAIKEVLKNPAAALERSKRGRDLVSHYSWQQRVSRILAFIQKIVQLQM